MSTTSWTDHVDANLARARIRQLRSHGMNLDEISQCSGVPLSTMRALNNPARKRIYRSTLESLEAVHPAHRSTGSRRRLQALAVLGWSLSAISRDSGVGLDTLARLRRGSRSIHDTAVHEAIAAAYDRLWDQPTPVDKATGNVRATARRNGWAPPIAWDDETIDDPTAKPQGVGVDEYRTPATTEAQWRLALGEPIETVARDLGCDVETLRQRQRRDRKEAA